MSLPLICCFLAGFAAPGQAQEKITEGKLAGEERIFGEVIFVWRPPGEFQMGSPKTEEGRFDDEVQRLVKIARGFWSAKHECTQGQYKARIGNNTSVATGSDDLPVEFVTWDEASAYCEKLGEVLGPQPGWKVMLPTEAEWEYACRAGPTEPYAGPLDAMGWFAENSDRKPHPVGEMEPTAWGLWDMHGNVFELCPTWYEQDYQDLLADRTAVPNASIAGEAALRTLRSAAPPLATVTPQPSASSTSASELP